MFHYMIPYLMKRTIGLNEAKAIHFMVQILLHDYTLKEKEGYNGVSDTRTN